ncbi:hypothetical protein HY947_05840 [Candidatus Gottesmanbacteria bacterium]|nr:hypothetical protein [Candidatus Gottesmanbacteria bacterium]
MLKQITANHWLLIIAAIYLTLYAAHAVLLQKTVYGDGIYYFSWMRSIVVDHDINFTDEFAHFKVTQPYIKVNVPGNKYAIGFPLLLSPWFTLTHLLVRGDGYGLIYQFVTGIVSVLYVIIGIILMHKTLTLYFPKLSSILSVLSLTLTTNLLFYGSIDPINSHSISFFLSALLISLLLSSKKTSLFSGLTVGLLASTRTQDALFILLLIPFLTKKSFFRTSLGFFLGFLPQIIAWLALYGSVTSPYLSNGEGFSLTLSHLPLVLFSTNNGLFLWTPLALFGCIGLCFSSKFPKKFLWSAFAVFCLEAILIGSWSTWWQGASFSGRMFVSTMPILTIGMASLYDKLQTKMIRMQSFLYMIPLGFGLINSLLIVYRLLLN